MPPTWLSDVPWLGRFGPTPYVPAVVLLALSLLAAKGAAVLAAAIARRLLRRPVPQIADAIAVIVHRAVLRTVVLIGLIAVGLLLQLPPGSARVLGAALRTVLVLVWVGAGIRGGLILLTGLSHVPAGPKWVVPTTVPLANIVLRVTVALVATYAVLAAWNVDVTGLVASAGIVGLALSFAAQDTLGNLFAGAAILVDQPYRIGDYIVLDSGERGQVTYVGLRSTRLLTRDDEEVSIPNGVIGRAKIVNESGGPHGRYRMRVKIGVAYGSDIDHVIAVLMQVASGHPAVAAKPEPRVRLRAFGESALEVELLAWIADPALRGLVMHELNCDLYRAASREGIVIPFPQRDLHIHDHRSADTPT